MTSSGAGDVGRARRLLPALTLSITVVGTSATAGAQGTPPPPPPPPPAGYEAQPGPAHPHPGYPPPGGYAHPPPGYGGAAPYYPYPPQPYGYPSAPPPGPARLDYEEGQPVPAGYRLTERPRKGLVVAGSVVFGVSYGLSLLVASVASIKDPGVMWLYVPVAGPFITLGAADIRDTEQILILDGIAQAGGAVMLLSAIASPKKELVRHDVAVPTFSLRPLVGRTSLGLGLSGSL